MTGVRPSQARNHSPRPPSRPSDHLGVVRGVVLQSSIRRLVLAAEHTKIYCRLIPFPTFLTPYGAPPSSNPGVATPVNLSHARQ
jgi:hypothetical protein